MKTFPPASMSAALFGALAVAGCAPLPPGERGPFTVENAGAAAGAINQSASGLSAETVATGASVNTTALATIHIIAKHKASERQRQVAIVRAQASFRKLAARHRERHPGAGQTGLPRYIAVDTVKNEQTAPGAVKSVMIWDTSAQEIVGNNVYDLSEAPPPGAQAKFETSAAEYVGSGN